MACHAVEDEQRRLLELDADLGGALAHALAGAEVEGHAGPAPVFDFEAEGGEGLGAGLGIDALFLAIADDVLAVDDAGAVLAADGVEDGMGGMARQTLTFSRRTLSASKLDGRLHGDEA